MSANSVKLGEGSAHTSTLRLANNKEISTMKKPYSLACFYLTYSYYTVLIILFIVIIWGL